MRGWPLREWCLILAVAVILVLPLLRLTHVSEPSPSLAEPEETAVAADPAGVEAWGELRFSHAPASFVLWRDAQELVRGGGELRADFDLSLQLYPAASVFRLEAVWPDEVSQAYVELTIEPDGYPAAHTGTWARGSFNTHLDISWPHQP
jgi:hypothetical protein